MPDTAASLPHHLLRRTGNVFDDGNATPWGMSSVLLANTRGGRADGGPGASMRAPRSRLAAGSGGVGGSASVRFTRQAGGAPRLGLIDIPKYTRGQGDGDGNRTLAARSRARPPSIPLSQSPPAGVALGRTRTYPRGDQSRSPPYQGDSVVGDREWRAQRQQAPLSPSASVRDYQFRFAPPDALGLGSLTASALLNNLDMRAVAAAVPEVSAVQHGGRNTAAAAVGGAARRGPPPSPDAREHTGARGVRASPGRAAGSAVGSGAHVRGHGVQRHGHSRHTGRGIAQSGRHTDDRDSGTDQDDGMAFPFIIPEEGSVSTGDRDAPDGMEDGASDGVGR